MNQTNQTQTSNTSQIKTSQKKCSNIFLEDDGYCTSCGRNHWTEAFGKVYFYQPNAVNKEETSSYSDMEGSVDADANQAEYNEKGKRVYTVVVTKENGKVTKIEAN